MFKELKRVAYQVPDLAAAQKWYADLLGMDPFFEFPGMVVFMIGQSLLALVESRQACKPENSQVFAFWEVDDVDKTLHRLTDSGASVHSAPRDFLYTRLAQAKDPFGNIIGLAGFAPGTEAQTIKNQPSVTAMGVAYYRAQAAQDKRPEIKGPDVYASLFLSEEFRSQLIARPILRPMYGYFIARTAFIDLAFEEAIQNGTPQIVILGAGYDSRAYRFHDRLKETRVFELDTPATQNRKRTVLREQALPVPPRLSFVPVDLKTDDFIKKLENAGFNQKLRSLFISEGLLYYLTETDVDKLLTAIAMNCIPGSRLCFDYMTSKLLSVNPGEPIQFWLEKTKMESYLTARGLRILDHLDNKAMIRRYLTLQDGTIAEKPTSHFGLILAEVNR